MKKLKTVDADTLLYQPLDKPSFVVDGLIPTGLSLFCGAQKIGKSWLMLKLCLCVSEGRPLWELPTTPGDVLYLCLEDTFYRIQDRLFRLTDEASDRLRFAVASCKLTDGLVGQLEDYLKERPGTRLIVIDTLQKIRTASKDNVHKFSPCLHLVTPGELCDHVLSGMLHSLSGFPIQISRGVIGCDLHRSIFFSYCLLKAVF